MKRAVWGKGRRGQASRLGLVGSGVMAGLVAGLLAGCAPAPLRPQKDAALRVEARLAGAAVQTDTQGELYRPPGPGALLVRSDRPAFLTSLFVPPSGGVQVLPTVATQAGQTVSVPLPGTLGFTQVFTVASLEPLNLNAAQGARSLNDAARVVEAQAATLPRGAYTVATTVYRVVRFGSVAVSSNQPGAEVRVNGRLAGYAPLVIRDLPEGEVTVDVSRSGYVTATRKVEVRPDDLTEVRVNLRPQGGTLIVQSDIPAQVLVGGQSAGRTPVRLSLRPGTVGVNVIPDNAAYRAETLLVRVRLNTDLTIACAVNSGEYRCRTK